ncbi:MAG: hypothetical protein ACXWUE_41500, partial [Polyangiales bacterium]
MRAWEVVSLQTSQAFDAPPTTRYELRSEGLVLVETTLGAQRDLTVPPFVVLPANVHVGQTFG